MLHIDRAIKLALSFLKELQPLYLVDDDSHRHDVENHIRQVLNVIWKGRADTVEQEVCQMLGVGSLRDYFRKPTAFFDDHLKRYSDSRRQAPIYLPLSTASNSYALWVYYHRLTDQTLYTCVNDFIEPKLKQVEEELNRLRSKGSRTRAEEKDMEYQIGLDSDLKDFRAELLRIAAFWQPNLNDGVQITVAPLWGLFAHKGWSKRLRLTWEELEAGEYDWSHLAYAIWPDRVLKKCESDESLAITHGLEAVYAQSADNTVRKSRRKVSRKPMADASEDLFDEY